MVSNVNLPSAQLQIAMGVPLHRIKDIRILFGEAPWAETLLDFSYTEVKPQPKGHVIAARITSENPDEGDYFAAMLFFYETFLDLCMYNIFVCRTQGFSKGVEAGYYKDTIILRDVAKRQKYFCV